MSQTTKLEIYCSHDSKIGVLSLFAVLKVSLKLLINVLK